MSSSYELNSSLMSMSNNDSTSPALGMSEASSYLGTYGTGTSTNMDNSSYSSSYVNANINMSDMNMNSNKWKWALIFTMLIAAAALGIALYQLLGAPSLTVSTANLVTNNLDLTKYPAALPWSTTIGNSWKTFTPTSAYYKVFNGHVAYTINFTFTPVISATASATVIDYIFQIPIKIAQPFGYNGVTDLNNVARCTGTATLGDKNWRAFGSMFSGSRDDSVHVKFVRWEEPFNTDQNNYNNTNTFITTDGTGTGTITIYYASIDATL